MLVVSFNKLPYILTTIYSFSSQIVVNSIYNERKFTVVGYSIMLRNLKAFLLCEHILIHQAFPKIGDSHKHLLFVLLMKPQI